MSRALRASSASKPSTSRIVITIAWVSGSAAIASSTTAIVSAASRRSSGPHALGGAAQCPGKRVSSPRNRSGSTAGSDSSPTTAENGIDRPSRWPRVFAMFVRMRKIQVLRLERPSKAPIPLRTASQVSCTTSSATARLATYMRATRSIDGPYSLTSRLNVSSSPSRSAPTTEVSTGCTVRT